MLSCLLRAPAQKGVHSPRWWHGYVRPCASRYVLRGTLLDVELMEPLSVKLTERTLPRTLQEFAADVNAHECRLWVLLMFEYRVFKNTVTKLLVCGSGYLDQRGHHS